MLYYKMTKFPVLGRRGFSLPLAGQVKIEENKVNCMNKENMDKRMYQILLTSLDYASQAVLYFEKEAVTPFLANKQALLLFGDQMGKIDMPKIFNNIKASPSLEADINANLLSDGYALVHDISVLSNSGASLLCDVQLAYADENKDVMLMEIYLKKDTRLEVARAQVKQSAKAEGIFEKDLPLSLLHSNEHLLAIFLNQEGTAPCHSLEEALSSDVRGEIMEKVQKDLAELGACSVEIPLSDGSGNQQWHCLDLQVCHLDNSGEKVMAQLKNVQKYFDMERKFWNVSRHFQAFQEISDDILLHLDLSRNLLSWKEKQGNTVKMVDFPQSMLESGYIFAQDRDKYLDSCQRVMSGESGQVELRVRLGDDYEYRKFLWNPVVNYDGSVTEVLGRALNLRSVQDRELTLENINKQFDVLTKITKETLFIVDLRTKLLVHRGSHPAKIGVDMVEENFPECIYPRVHPDDLPGYQKHANKLLSGQDSGYVARIRIANGDFEWYQTDCHVVFNEKGSPSQILGTVKNIHQHKANTVDMLTQCLNKTGMLEQVGEILENSQEQERHALIFLDLDNFEEVNDCLGHDFGDFVLAELSRRLKHSIRGKDLLGRVGGDEFVLFIRNIPSSNILMGKAKMILSAISEDFVRGGKHHSIQGSIGISVFPDHGNTYEELYHYSDLALIESKNSGKNTASVYNSEKKTEN